MTGTGSKAIVAECWQHVHKGLAPTVLRTQAEVDKHKAMGHDVREVTHD